MNRSSMWLKSQAYKMTKQTGRIQNFANNFTQCDVKKIKYFSSDFLRFFGLHSLLNLIVND